MTLVHRPLVKSVLAQLHHPAREGQRDAIERYGSLQDLHQYHTDTVQMTNELGTSSGQAAFSGLDATVYLRPTSLADLVQLCVVAPLTVAQARPGTKALKCAVLLVELRASCK